MKKQNYFLSQPHQPFFLLGALSAIVMMLIFALSYKGVLVLSTSSYTFHVYSLVFILFTNVFTGFLFTTFPRFCQSEIISKKYYTNLFYTALGGALLFLVGAFVSHVLLLLGMFVSLVSHIFVVLKLQNIYETGRVADKSDAFWILRAYYFGLFGNALFFLAELSPYIGLEFDMLSLATKISFYLYLIFLAFSVAQRMIPFFSHSFEPKSEKFVKIVFALFIFKVLSSTFGILFLEVAVDLMLGAYTLYEFRRWKLPLFDSPAILWVLHLALFWMPVAFFISAFSLVAEYFLESSFYFLNVHLLAIGFLTTLLIGFGTRVTLGHSGQAPHADKFVTNLFWFIQVVVILRALFSLNVAFGWNAAFLFDISFSAWLILFILWSYRYAKVLVFGSKV